MDEFLKDSPWKTVTKFYKGDVYGDGKSRRPDSGFTVFIGEDADVTLTNQVTQAVDFLFKYERELDRAYKCGADSLVFDFGFAPPQQLQSYVYLPPTLLIAMAQFRMGVIFSVIQMPQG